MNLSFEFRPRVLDLSGAGISALLAKRWLLYIFVIFFVILPILVFGLLLAIYYVSKEMQALFHALLILLVVPSTLLVFAFIPVLINYRAFKSSRMVEGVHTYHFSEEFIELSGPGFNSKIEWDNLSKCFKSRFGLLLYCGILPYAYIPMRAFHSQEDLFTACESINSKIDETL